MKRKSKNRVISGGNHRFSYLLAVVIAGLGTLVYFGGIASAVQLWSRSPDEQHGFLVLPIALLLLYLKRDEFPKEAVRIDLRGCLLLLVAAGMRVYGDAYVRPWMEMWSLPIWIGGVVWLFGGWELFCWALPPIAFLFFMAPMPGQMQTVAGFPLQIVAATGGGWLLQMLGQPALVSGTTILLGENSLEVERACAGLRMFQGMLAVSIAWSLFSRYSWRRLLVLFAIAPLVAILVNVLRIAVTGLLFQYVSGEAAKSFTHDWAGILMIPTGALVYFCIDTFVDRLRAWNRQYPERWLFTISMITVGVLFVAFAGFTIQKRQQHAAIDLVLNQARELSSKNTQKGMESAAQLYEQYLAARPEDADVHSEYAEFSQQFRNDPLRAFYLYERAWKVDPSRSQDAIKALNVLKDRGAWKMLWETSDEMVSKLSSDQRIEAMRLRTNAIAQHSDNTIAMAGIEKMLRSCQASMKDDYEFLEHTWQCARLTRLQTGSDGNNETVETIVAELPDAAKTRYPFDSESRESEKEFRRALRAPTAKALALIDKWIATHSQEPMPLLYRVALLDEAAGKSPGEPWINSIKQSIEMAIGYAMGMVEKSIASGDGKTDSLVAARVYFIAGQRAMDQNPEQAKGWLDRCRELQPRGYQAYVLLGKMLPIEALDEKITLFQEAVKHCGFDELAITLPLAEAYVASGREDDAQKLLDKLASRASSLPTLEKSKITLMLASTRASGLAQNGLRRKGIETLSNALRSQDVITQRRNLASLYARAQFQLGSLFRSVGQEDAAAAAFQEGRRFDDNSTLSQLELAKTLEKEGNYKAAIEQYKRLAKVIGNQEPRIYLSIAKCQLMLQTREKSSEGSLREVRRMIQDADKRGADSAAACALLAESYVMENDLESAKKIIAAQLEKTPASLDLLFSNAIIRQISGDLNGALVDAKKYEIAGAKPSDALLLRVMIWERSERNDNLEKASSEIETAATKFSAEELKAAKVHLALSYFRKGQAAEAAARLESLRVIYKDDLPIQILTAELFANARGAEPKLIEVEENLIQIEGKDGMHWQAIRAARLLRHNEMEDIVEADKLIANLEQIYPAWSRTHFLRGQMNENKGRLPQALESFKSAWDLGLRDANLAIRYLSALNQTGKYQEASNLILQLEYLVPNSVSLFDRAMPQLVQSKKSDYVLELARRWASESPSYENYVRLGETLMTVAKSRQSTSDLRSTKETANMLSEAAKNLEDAIQLDPTNPRAWIASFQLQVQNLRDREGAMAKLEQLSKQLKMPPFWRSYVLARLYNEIGEGGRAGAYFDETLRLANGETDRVRLAATLDACQFLSIRRMEKAIQLYRRILAESKSTDEPARSRLIALLSQQPNLNYINEAIELHNAKTAISVKSEPNDKLVQSKLLATRAGLYEQMADPSKLTEAQADRDGALKLLESINPRNAEIADLLADHYAATGKPILALNAFKDALTKEAGVPERMIRFLNFWNKEFAKSNDYGPLADKSLNELKQIAGYAPEWLRLSLERIKKQFEAKRELEVASQASLESKLISDYCNSFLAKDSIPELSNAIHELLLGLSRAGRVDLISLALEQADEKLKQAAASTRTEVVPSAIAASTIRLSSNQPFAEQLAQRLMDQYPAQSLDSASHAREIGDAIYISGQPNKAKDYYRQAILKDPNDVNSINNLAAAIAESGGSSEEANALSDKAIEMEPNNSERKDTKLVVAILLKEWDVAQSISSELSSQFVSTMLLHRAVVAAEMGDVEESLSLFSRSRDAGIEQNLVVPSDRQMYQRLANLHFKAERNVVRPGPES